MKKNIIKLFSIAMALFLSFSLAPLSNTYADEEVEATEEAPTAVSGTSISLTPTSKILQIASGSTYDEVFAINNNGSAPIRIEVYAAPYSYVYSNEEDLYKLGFNNENNYTQLSRWISFKDSSGNYVEKANFSIEPNSVLDIHFRITTPENIPGGGQYAVIFAHTLSNATGGGIRTEASPGMVVYGRSTEGEAVVSAEISDLSVDQKVIEGRSGIFATAKVKNTGNVDFTATGTLKVEPIIGFGSYESSAMNGRMSIIPEAELSVSDAWLDAPSLGIFKATWTVKVGDTTEVIERVIFRISPIFIVISIIVLTIVVVSIIMGVRKRKERRSRLSV